MPLRRLGWLGWAVNSQVFPPLWTVPSTSLEALDGFRFIVCEVKEVSFLSPQVFLTIFLDWRRLPHVAVTGASL